jgi:MraZ protein
MLKSYGLTGRSDNKVDAKGRINIPAQMRKVLAPEPYDEVVILLSSEGHLALFNHEYWVGTIQQNMLNKADAVVGSKEWITIKRSMHRLSENSHLSTVDNQGRITIPAWLLEKAGIAKDAVLIGAADRVSVWSPETYAAWMGSEDEDSAVTGVYI